MALQLNPFAHKPFLLDGFQYLGKCNKEVG